MKINKNEMIKKLEAEVVSLESQLYSASYFAYHNLNKCHSMNMGGVILTIRTLSGKNIVDPVCIKDGLSLDTVEALRKDLIRTQKDTMDWTIKEKEEK